MTANTLSHEFRKLDIDQYNEDCYVDESGGESAEIQTQLGPDEGEVNSLLQSGQACPALKAVIKNAPISTKGFEVKEKAFALAMKSMLAVRTSEMDGFVKSLDLHDLDVLMKYIYKGFEYPTEGSSGHLLAWHEKAFAVGGVGSIIRVMTDRKSV